MNYKFLSQIITIKSGSSAQLIQIFDVIPAAMNILYYYDFLDFLHQRSCCLIVGIQKAGYMGKSFGFLKM